MENTHDSFNSVLTAIESIIEYIEYNSKKQSKKSGISWCQLVLMKEVQNHSNGISITKLVERLGISQFKVASTIDRLVSKNFICKHRNGEDKRSWTLQLSEDGCKLVDNVLALRKDFMSKFHRLPEWQQYQILSTLQVLEDMLRL